MPLKHRNSQKRIYFKDACYFITTNTYDWFPYFKEPIFCDLFVENLRICKKLKQFKLYGWVICYDHVHLLIEPSDKWNYSKIMQSLKRNFSHNANIVMREIEGANNYSRLQFRGFLEKFRNQLIQKYGHTKPFPKFQWHKSFHDHYIRDEQDFQNHLDYIHGNLDKHELPRDWPYVFTNLAYRQAGPKYQDLIDEF